MLGSTIKPSLTFHQMEVQVSNAGTHCTVDTMGQDVSCTFTYPHSLFYSVNVAAILSLSPKSTFFPVFMVLFICECAECKFTSLMSENSKYST